MVFLLTVHVQLTRYSINRDSFTAQANKKTVSCDLCHSRQRLRRMSNAYEGRQSNHATYSQATSISVFQGWISFKLGKHKFLLNRELYSIEESLGEIKFFPSFPCGFVILHEPIAAFLDSCKSSSIGDIGKPWGCSGIILWTCNLLTSFYWCKLEIWQVPS